MIKKIQNYFNNIIQTIKLLIHSSLTMSICIVIINITSGILVSGKIWIWKKIVDIISVVLQNSNISYNGLYIFIIIEFSLAFGIQLLDDISQYIQVIFGEKVDRDINEIIMKKIQTLSLADFEDSESYNIIQKANEQTLGRSVGLLNTIVQLIKNIASSISIIFLIASFNSLIVVLCFLTTIPLFIITNIINEKMYDIYNKRFEKIRFAHYLMRLCLKYENIKELKVFDTMEYIKKYILEIYDKNIEEDKKIRKKFTRTTASMDFIDIIVTYGIKLSVILSAILKRVTIGSIVAYVESIDVLKTSVKNSMSMIAGTYEDSMYLENIFILLKMGNEKNEKKNIIHSINKIEFKNVYFKYSNSDNYALKDFSFKFSSEKSYGIIGLNGSGKTTLIKLILGLYEIEKGEILVNGLNINKIDLKSYRKAISAIFQDFIRYPFDVKTNLTLSDYTVEFSDEDIRYALEFSGCADFIEELRDGYHTKLGKEWANSVELSLGQWQKLAVSRAVLKKADMLILDEPTSSLDALTEYNIFKNLRNKSIWKIIILVTHRLKNVKGMSEIIVLKDGQLKEMGNFESLIKLKGEFYSLYMMQEREEDNTLEDK